MGHIVLSIHRKSYQHTTFITKIDTGNAADSYSVSVHWSIGSDAFSGWKTLWDKAETVAEETVGEAACYKVVLTPAEGDPLTAWFDKETGLLVQEELPVPQMGTSMTTTYGDYREVDGVKVIGHTNLPAEIPAHASQMYAKNLVTFLKHLLDEGRIQLDLEDEITSGALLTHEGAITNEMIRSKVEGSA